KFGPLVQRGEVFARMGLEGHDGGHKPTRLGFAPHARQDGLVAPVHAVEIADGKRARRAPWKRGKVAVDAQRRFHEREFTISGCPAHWKHTSCRILPSTPWLVPSPAASSSSSRAAAAT